MIVIFSLHKLSTTGVAAMRGAEKFAERGGKLKIFLNIPSSLASHEDNSSSRALRQQIGLLLDIGERNRISGGKGFSAFKRQEQIIRLPSVSVY